VISCNKEEIASKQASIVSIHATENVAQADQSSNLKMPIRFWLQISGIIDMNLHENSSSGIANKTRIAIVSVSENRART